MKTGERATVAIIFHRFGPYHVARLAAAARIFNVRAVEEVAETSEYAWDAVRQTEIFSRTTLLKAGERPSHPAREIASRVTTFLEKARPDAVAIPGWSDPAALAALRWAAVRKVPAIVMSESAAQDETRQSWKEWLKGRVVRLCSAGLVGGQPHARYLAALGMDRAKIFSGYDAVDNVYFAAGARRVRLGADSARTRLSLPERYFLASNRFVPQKNLPVLLSAYAAYRRAAGPEAWKLVLLGDGPLRDELRAQLTALGIEDEVLLPGFKQYAELPDYYGLAGAFVHASAREPWGLVVNEAMAAGLPVLVANRCGCAEDLVSEGVNGWTFSPEDPAALTDLLMRVASCDPESLRTMGEASQRRIEDWSPLNFAANLARAVDAAQAHGRHGLGTLDRLTLALLLHRAEGSARRLLPEPPRPSANR